MADRTPRFLWDNLTRRAASIASASSEDSAATLQSLKDPQVTRYYRSVYGWNINTWNNKIDFHVNVPVGVAVVPIGNYSTGAALATAMTAAMAAASPGHASAVFTYDTVTGKFHYHQNGSGSVMSLMFATGVNAASSIGPDIGFPADTTTTSGVVDVDGAAVYRSREWLRWDLGSALPFTVGALLGHNLGAAGTVTLVAKATADIWNAPTFSQVLAGDSLSRIRIAFFAQQSYRYVGLMFTGVPAQVLAAAVVFVGAYWQPARGYQRGMTRQPILLGLTSRNIDGALFRDRRRMWIDFKLNLWHLPYSDLTTYLQMLDETQASRLLLALDPQNFPGSRTHYGIISEPGSIPEQVGDGDPPDRYDIAMTFSEEKEEANP